MKIRDIVYSTNKLTLGYDERLTEEACPDIILQYLDRTAHCTMPYAQFELLIKPEEMDDIAIAWIKHRKLEGVLSDS